MIIQLILFALLLSWLLGLLASVVVLLWQQQSRWINHACAPNCDSEEGRAGKRVYIVANRDIARGEELNYDYGLVMDDKITQTIRDQYACRCGASTCRGTMLSVPKKKKSKKTSKKSGQG